MKRKAGTLLEQILAGRKFHRFQGFFFEIREIKCCEKYFWAAIAKINPREISWECPSAKIYPGNKSQKGQ